MASKVNSENGFAELACKTGAFTLTAKSTVRFLALPFAAGDAKRLAFQTNRRKGGQDS